MKIHETIKIQLIEAMRAKDTIRLDVIRGLLSAFSNELISKGSSEAFIDDENASTLIRRSVKQHKDSIEQFEKGNRTDLAEKEKAELVYLEAYLPKMMSRNEILKFVNEKISIQGGFDKSKANQFIGQIMKELKGKADGSDVKAVIDNIVV